MQTAIPWYVLWCDFDETLGHTFAPSPNHVGVKEAYKKAVWEIFGATGIAIYEKINGFQNHAPGQFVRELLLAEPSLVEVGHHFFSSVYHSTLVWDIQDPATTLTEILVQEKMRILVAEIGTEYDDGRRWPEPFPGVVELYQTVDAINQRRQMWIDTGIISSGHTSFIERVFDLWNVSLPAVLVTDDHIRCRKFPTDPTLRCKPALLPFALAYVQLLERHRSAPGLPFRALSQFRPIMLYIGDDPEKDGKLAAAAGVAFCCFDPKGEAKLEPGQGRLTHWSQLTRLLLQLEQEVLSSPVKTMARVISPLVSVAAA